MGYGADSDLTLKNFAAQVPAMAGGNTYWAASYARDLREIATRAATRDPRSAQKHLGPSELGHICDRLVVGKMTGQQITNHVVSPWPSIIGRAVHVWLADAFAQENTINGVTRWIPEHRVAPDPRYPGTADLYDYYTRSLVDHKILGKTTMSKVMSPQGPPWYYVVQLLLYAHGYRRIGHTVDRVVLAAWPRTAPSLDGLYCWERPYVPSRDDFIVQQVLALTAVREQVAQLVLSGQIRIEQVRRTPSDECFFCPWYRPQSALDNGPGCPGHSAPG
jgi:hypothetical protein